MKKFKRVNQHAVVGGVCGGLAYWLELPAWIVRLLMVVSVLSYGFGLMPYVLIALFAPAWKSDPDDYESITDDD